MEERDYCYSLLCYEALCDAEHPTPTAFYRLSGTSFLGCQGMTEVIRDLSSLLRPLAAHQMAHQTLPEG